MQSTDTEAGGAQASTSKTSPEDQPRLAATLMVTALALLGLQDAIIKLTTSEVSIWQFQMLRAMFNLFLLLCLIVFFGKGHGLRPRRPWAIVLRSLAMVGAMLCFFGGLPFLSLSEIAAGLYLFPLFIIIFSGILLGERVGPRRIGAVLAGFVGSLLILKPGTANFQTISLLPVCAGMFYACMVLTTRRLCREESPYTLAMGVSTAFMTVGAVGVLLLPPGGEGATAAFGNPYLTTGWHELTALLVMLIIVCSFLNLTANVSLARAYQSAESSWLAPFDYTYLIFAAFWGYVFWQTIPDAFSVAGMALIAASGTFVTWRERVESSKRAEATSATT